MRKNFILAGLAALLIAACPSPGAAADNPVLTVRGGAHPDFERLVFDWPRNVRYTVRRSGTGVTVEFGAAATPNFSDAQGAHLDHIKGLKAAQREDGYLLVSFAIGPNDVVRDFTSGTSIVVDVVTKPGAAKEEKKVAAETAKEAPKEAPKEPPKETVKTPPEKPVEAAQKEAVPAPPPAPAAPAQQAAAPVQPTASSPAPAPQKAEEPKPAPTPAPAETAKKAEVPAPPPAAATVPVTPAATPEITKAPQAKKAPLVLGAGSQLVVSLDPHTPTRAAVWQRAGYAYIVFDRKFTLGLDVLTKDQPPPMVDLEPLDLPKASGWRFAMPANAEIRATRQDTVWQVFLSRQHLEVPVSTALVAQPDFALGARLLLPLPDAPEPVKMTDPVAGDTLVLVPLAQTEAFSIARRMSDLSIVPAAQGLVISPINDRLIVRAVSDGVEITAEGGLHLSRAADTGAAAETIQRSKAAAAGKSVFDLIAWHSKPGESFTETRQRLQQTIADVPEAERNRARLELARFYFANGNGEEASALLHYLSILVPDLSSHADFMAISGASKILAYHPEDGLADFDSAPALSGLPEVELWQAVAESGMRDWKSAEEKFALAQSTLAGYPEPFYSKFSVLAVEAALAVGKDREAKDWLDRLENSPHRTDVDPGITYLHGVIHSKNGRAEAAEGLWKEVAQSNDRLYRIRAELALIDLDVATGAMTPDKAADRLEALRFGWRGDDLELDILHRLGAFYIQAKNVKAGLSVLNQAIQLYPKSPLITQIRTEMGTIFRDVFLGDLAPDMSAVDALTLYQTFRDLMPPGADGINIIRNLAERLVAIDLLDQASDLLEELVQNRLQGLERGRVATRLAAIRLLDHKPQAALAALDMSNDNSYPGDLLTERQLLRAKALSEEGKDDDALELLKESTGKEAKILRADITLHAQRWSETSKNLLELIGAPPKPGETLTNNQADWLVRCAIAMSLADDQEGLGKLAVDFGAAMAPMPQNDTFRVLTQPQNASLPKDVEAVRAKIADVDLFQGFLNAYRKSPDDKDKKAPAAKP